MLCRRGPITLATAAREPGILPRPPTALLPVRATDSASPGSPRGPPATPPPFCLSFLFILPSSSQTAVLAPYLSAQSPGSASRQRSPPLPVCPGNTSAPSPFPLSAASRRCRNQGPSRLRHRCSAHQARRVSQCRAAGGVPPACTVTAVTVHRKGEGSGETRRDWNEEGEKGAKAREEQ